ncbi:LytR/AlgR family response regulator transcription factor [Acidicapsa ligni]|uniref:LytR/AlgR family response regulator transcription factor n=1 Tax=Acidicapsa ligni TaxID=542300 RepID=UPI0021E09AEC|nr:LytTR family DNA-binding domain-containing protein [Acidicapsa ligni]
MTIRLILIDDEPVARLGVRARLRKHTDFKIVEEASTAEEALEKICRLQPDAIFLDVEILNSSGLDIARILDERPAKPIIVFLTAHRQYALQAFDVEATDYLLKPINDIRFEITLNRIREALALQRAGESDGGTLRENAQESYSVRSMSFAPIAVPSGKRTRLIEVNDIDWISASGDYTKLHVRGNTHLLREPLSTLLNKLPPNVFYRIHRSSVLNLSRVADFITLRNQDLLVTLKDGTVLRASRTFSEELKRALLQR